jgi:hypothetical protein
MKIQTRIHLPGLEQEKTVVERIVNENLNGKLDRYLAKFSTKKDVEGTIDLTMEKSKKGFNATLKIIIDGNSFRYEREDYKKLDDLINHLFEHFKVELSKK